VTTENQIIELLKDLRAEGRVMLVSTHNLGSVPEFCDRVVLINRSVLAEGPTGDEVFTQDNLPRPLAACSALRAWRTGPAR
jgi:manganese/iron transport system ATP-binding protein